MAQDGAFVHGGGVAGLFARVFRAGLDALLPPRCLSCGAAVEGQALCPSCWRRVRFLAPPVCDACGIPFAAEAGEGALCGACATERPVFARARAAFAYDAESRGLILAFKHGDHTDSAPAFGVWLMRAGAELLADADLIAPVPLHWTRLFARRYNQAALLAHALRARTGIPVAARLLVRRRRTPSQGILGRAARQRNLAGAIMVPAKQRARVAGRRILLVDDVLTTGATAEACARALLAADATAVDVLTLARVVRAE
jgi:ComF family protein